MHGLPIRPAFTKRQPPRRKLRKQLGLRRDEPAVFLVGGGEGMGPVERTVESIAAGPGARVQLVVVCGRNAKLVKRLSEKVRSALRPDCVWLRTAVSSLTSLPESDNDLHVGATNCQKLAKRMHGCCWSASTCMA